MNPELEALLKSFDAFKQASGPEARRLALIYQSHLQDALQRHPNISRHTLQQMIDHSYRDWCRAQEKPSALPPRA